MLQDGLVTEPAPYRSCLKRSRIFYENGAASERRPVVSPRFNLKQFLTDEHCNIFKAALKDLQCNSPQ